MKLDVEKVGLGYRVYYVPESIGLHIDRIVESRSTGEVSAELTVAQAPTGHLVRTRFNLVSMTTRTSLAKHLQTVAPLGKNGPTWLQLLERFCIDVLEVIRRGEPLETVGDRESDLVLDYLVRPMIHRGKSTLLFGDGGIGKSTLAVALGVSLGLGRPVFPGWEVKAPGRTMILDWEDDGSTWNDRIRKCAAGFGEAAPKLHYQRMRQPLHMAVNDIAAKVAENGIDLVLVDSVQRAMPGRTEGGDASDSFKRLWDALELLETASLLIDHVSKSQEGRTTVYGSTMKNNWVRASYELREDEQDPDDQRTRHLVLLDRKENHAAKAAPVGIALHYSATAWVLGSEEARLGDARSVKDAVLWMRVREFLGRVGKASVAEIVDGVGIEGTNPDKVIRNALGRKPNLFGREENDDGIVWFLLSDMPEPKSGKHASTSQGSNASGGREAHRGDTTYPNPPGASSHTPAPDASSNGSSTGKFASLEAANEERWWEGINE